MVTSVMLVSEDAGLHLCTLRDPAKPVSNAAEHLKTWKTKLLSLPYHMLFPLVCKKTPNKRNRAIDQSDIRLCNSTALSHAFFKAYDDLVPEHVRTPASIRQNSVVLVGFALVVALKKKKESVCW